MSEQRTIPDLIARVRELDEAATKGPWRAGACETWHVFCPSEHDDAMGPERVLLRMNEHFYFAPDAALIAEFRSAAPLLADECERLQERVRVLEGLLTRVVKYVVEDRAVTPGVTRLGRVVSEARAALAVKP